MKIKTKIIKTMYSLTYVMAVLAVNSTCHFHFYQEKMNPQLDSLKKYHEE